MYNTLSENTSDDTVETRSFILIPIISCDTSYEGVNTLWQEIMFLGRILCLFQNANSCPSVKDKENSWPFSLHFLGSLFPVGINQRVSRIITTVRQRHTPTLGPTKLVITPIALPAPLLTARALS